MGQHRPHGSCHCLCHLFSSPRAMGLCSITVLLGTALLLLAPGSTQVSSPSTLPPPSLSAGSEHAWAQRGPPQVQAGPEVDHDQLHHRQDDAREANADMLLWMLSLEVQNDPEEDRDHLYHPQDDAKEADTYKSPRMLSLEVQKGPEEDRDHIYHS
uniref:Uncharacterized protein n=1 Tax=Malurus cyaneus samueli TaxID=2593467 RepID=A0A8C5TXP7_9PASS